MGTNSTARDTKFRNTFQGAMTVKNSNQIMPIRNDIELKLNNIYNKMSSRRLGTRRQEPKIKMLESLSDGESDGPELFTAIPSDDIPHNKLTEQLARGLQAYV